MEIYDRNDLAGSFRADGVRPLQLWAGESQKVTEARQVKDGIVFAKYEVYSIDGDGYAIKCTGNLKARGFTAQHVPADGTTLQGYIAGSPNHEALVWPSDLTTLEQRRAAFYGTGMYVGELKLNPTAD